MEGIAEMDKAETGKEEMDKAKTGKVETCKEETGMAEILGIGAAVFVRARDSIRAEGTSCVVIRGEEVVHTADGRGVAPLLALYKEDIGKLAGSSVVDRIIGKAAAMILVLAGVRSVYGDVMSLAAQTYLSARGIPFGYGQSVERILAQNGTDLCPIESSVLAIDDPAAGLAAITQRVAELRGAAV